MMTTQTGKLLYISDNAAEYLGHSMVSNDYSFVPKFREKFPYLGHFRLSLIHVFFVHIWAKCHNLQLNLCLILKPELNKLLTLAKYLIQHLRVFPITNVLWLIQTHLMS